MKDRFDLEAEIHNVWDTEKDLDIILYRMMDASEAPVGDEIANMLIGLKEIHSSRCMKLWDTFEGMVKNDCFKHPEEELKGFATDKEAGFVDVLPYVDDNTSREELDSVKKEKSQKQKEQWRNYVTESLEHPLAKSDDQKNIKKLREQHE